MNREDTQAKNVGQKAESATAQAENAAYEAADAVREVTDNFGKALDAPADHDDCHGGGCRFFARGPMDDVTLSISRIACADAALYGR
jgi:hypothetical protein